MLEAYLNPQIVTACNVCFAPVCMCRLAILQASARRMQLGPDANLEIVAAQTEGYTGKLCVGVQPVCAGCAPQTSFMALWLNSRYACMCTSIKF